MDDIYNAIVIGRAKWAYSFCMHACAWLRGEARRCDDSRIAVGIVARRGESRHWEIEGKVVGWELWRCPLPWWVGGALFGDGGVTQWKTTPPPFFFRPRLFMEGTYTHWIAIQFVYSESETNRMWSRWRESSHAVYPQTEYLASPFPFWWPTWLHPSRLRHDWPYWRLPSHSDQCEDNASVRRITHCPTMDRGFAKVFVAELVHAGVRRRRRRQENTN